MPKVQVARHPLNWGMDRVAASLNRQADIIGGVAAGGAAVPLPNAIGFRDLGAALAAGFEDFKRFRTDVIFLCFIYPVVGLALGKFVLGGGLFYLAFPLVAGFALLGPLFAAGLYEMSRQSEFKPSVTWANAFDAFRSPAIVSIVGLGLILVALFVAWLATAQVIYWITLAPLFPPGQPPSLDTFGDAVFSTGRGTALMILGIGVGFCFAVVALALTVVSFPLLLDRNVSVREAVDVSIKAVRKNPVPMAAWGLIVATLMVLGSLPFLIGLAFVLPILGHATWHLYRRVIPH